MALSAYIHIPFCSHKCDFCDFTAFAGLDHMAKEYSWIVQQEIAGRVAREPNSTPLSSVFYGGGTPGLVPAEQIADIQRTLAEAVGLEDAAEVTLETTPQSITAEKAVQWQELGINRLSIGVQSFQDQELDAMGRGHSAAVALTGIETAVKSGFGNISCDLMYGLPRQTLDSWERSLDTALALKLPHMSAYGLTIAQNSPLLSRFPRDSAAYPQEDQFADMYELLVKKAESAGLRQYEISNFSRPGFESRHNYAYWNNEEYLAFGVGAHRYVNGVRSSNWRSLARYMKDWLGSETSEVISDSMRAKEAIFLRLRTREGIRLDDFRRQYGLDLRIQCKESLIRLQEGGFVQLTDERLALTQQGILVSNLVMAELI
jgi:putative oxygen-independent coproporphyrinogen III oxidase